MGAVMRNGNMHPFPGLCSQALTPWNDTENFAAVWLDLYFKRFADNDPTSGTVAVFDMEKGHLYEKYVQFCQLASKEPNLMKRTYVSLQTFYNIWLSLYPYACLKRKCHIIGKCTTCYLLQAARLKTSDSKVLEAIKQDHALHRSTYMGERNYYQATIYHSISNMSTTLSVIVDGTDSITMMPSLGSQRAFTKPLGVGITGALVHGEGMTLFRTLNNVHKGANLTIFILLHVLNKWVIKYKRYPDEIFFQADGGSENANKYVLAFMEFLVAKRLAQRAYFSRLLVGHTHNDVDGMFGTLSSAFHNQILETLDSFDAFINSGRLPMFNLHDLMIIPDFESYFEPHIDPYIKKLHKEIHTQHQWIFTAIAPTAENNGRLVNVQYKAYTQEMVIEIIEKPVNECKSTIGKLTGFEPVLTYVDIFPVYPETINFLETIPCLPAEALFIPPEPFQDRCLEEFRETKLECRGFFQRGSKAHDCWKFFFEEVAPKTLCPYDYLSQIRLNPNLKKYSYIIPFMRLFKGSTLPIKPLSDNCRYFNEIPNWQMTVKAYATPSVASRNNRNPPPPRLLIINDENESQFYNSALELVQPFFSATLCLTQAEIGSIISELLTPDGKSVSKSGTKKFQVSNFEDFFKSVLSSFAQTLNKDDELAVIKKLTEPHSSTSMANMRVATITVSGRVVHLTKTSLQCLQQGKVLSNEIISFIYLLFTNYNKESLIRRRDNFGEDAPEPNPEPNPNRNHRQPIVFTHKKCLTFLSSLFLRALLTRTTSEIVDKESINDSKFIYIHVKEDVSSSLLIVIDMAKGRFYYYDPMLTSAIPNTLLLNNIKHKYNTLLCELLQSYSTQLGLWDSTKVWLRVETPYITPPANEFACDKDVYILSFVYFQLHYLNAPLVFNQSSVESFRKKIALWILTEKMPSQFY